ncbi:Diguanylate cyclase/phosphodiesterase [Beijerinckiaceae bacterium RH AL1]|nr:Diguanylate cyclase/phosphodiesterase [Beijerinckiaceae bacterium RH AL1]
MKLTSRLVPVLLPLLMLLASLGSARAIESVRVPLDTPAIDLTKAIESYSSQGDRLLVSTAPGADGIVRRIEVRAKDPARGRAGSSSR